MNPKEFLVTTFALKLSPEIPLIGSFMMEIFRSYPRSYLEQIENALILEDLNLIVVNHRIAKDLC
jgi:hypothetical protein